MIQGLQNTFLDEKNIWVEKSKNIVDLITSIPNASYFDVLTNFLAGGLKPCMAPYILGTNPARRF